MNIDRQRRLPFESSKEEQRLARVEQLCFDKLKGRIKMASELNFSYEIASVIARRGNTTE